MFAREETERGNARRSAAARVTARTDTCRYPRNASGGRHLFGHASSSTAFQAASSSPNANQLRDASRSCGRNVQGGVQSCRLVVDCGMGKHS